MRLQGKVALITGASGGIGRAAAERFVAEGARVVLADIDADAVASLARELGAGHASHCHTDVGDDASMQAAVRHSEERFGGLDILVANAGIEGPIASIEDCPVEAFDRVQRVNVRGVWLGIRHAAPAMRRRGGGSILITSSGAGVAGYPNMSAYVCSKHAVIGIMRTATRELAPAGIRVNTVNPGPVETRMMESIATGTLPGREQDYSAALNAAIPLGRYAKPAEVANLMLFLASDEASYCSGGVYMVDAGNSA